VGASRRDHRMQAALQSAFVRRTEVGSSEYDALLPSKHVTASCSHLTAGMLSLHPVCCTTTADRQIHAC
jgi:hypothetical protein